MEKTLSTTSRHSKAANRFDTATARTLLDRGRQIDPTHPSIAPAEQFIQMMTILRIAKRWPCGLTDKVRATINALVQESRKLAAFASLQPTMRAQDPISVAARKLYETT